MRKLTDRRKEYLRIRTSEKRQKNKIKAVEYKGGKCEICGYNKCIAALSFHHRNPNEKDFQISKTTKSWIKIKDEIDKCMLLCSNCHSELHYSETIKKFNEKKAKWVSEIQGSSFQINCEQCGKIHKRFSSQRKKNNFCSRECRCLFYRKDYPPDDELKQMFLSMSVKDISNKINKPIKALYKQKHRLELK
jgi:hypothetical protein